MNETKDRAPADRAVASSDKRIKWSTSVDWVKVFQSMNNQQIVDSYPGHTLSAVIAKRHRLQKYLADKEQNEANWKRKEMKKRKRATSTKHMTIEQLQRLGYTVQLIPKEELLKALTSSPDNTTTTFPTVTPNNKE